MEKIGKVTNKVKWYKVEEHLPNSTRNVLIYSFPTDTKGVASFDGKHWINNGYQDSHVSHWTEMPDLSEDML